MNLIDRIKRWYNGEFVVYENRPEDPFVIIGGHQEYSRSAKFVRAIVAHISREWRYWLPVSLAVLSLPFLPFQCDREESGSRSSATPELPIEESVNTPLGISARESKPDHQE